MLLDPGPLSEEEMVAPRPSSLAVEKLKETVSRLPKRRQHLPGHPRLVYAQAQHNDPVVVSPLSLTGTSSHHTLQLVPQAL